MNDAGRDLELRRRREQLVAQCEEQRIELAAELGSWEVPFMLVDGAVSGFHYLRQHPLVVALLALLLTTQRRGLWGWVQRGLMAWRAYRAWRNA